MWQSLQPKATFFRFKSNLELTKKAEASYTNYRTNVSGIYLWPWKKGYNYLWVTFNGIRKLWCLMVKIDFDNNLCWSSHFRSLELIWLLNFFVEFFAYLSHGTLHKESVNIKMSTHFPIFLMAVFIIKEIFCFDRKTLI